MSLSLPLHCDLGEEHVLGSKSDESITLLCPEGFLCLGARSRVPWGEYHVRACECCAVCDPGTWGRSPCSHVNDIIMVLPGASHTHLLSLPTQPCHYQFFCPEHWSPHPSKLLPFRSSPATLWDVACPSPPPSNSEGIPKSPSFPPGPCCARRLCYCIACLMPNILVPPTMHPMA